MWISWEEKERIVVAEEWRPNGDRGAGLGGGGGGFIV